MVALWSPPGSNKEKSQGQKETHSLNLPAFRKMGALCKVPPGDFYLNLIGQNWHLSTLSSRKCKFFVFFFLIESSNKIGVVLVKKKGSTNIR